jgi:hypothetical protein
LPGLACVVMTRRTGIVPPFRVTRDRDGFASCATWCTGQAHAIVPQEGARRQQHHWEKAIMGQVCSTLNPCIGQDQGCRVCGACPQTVLRCLAPSAKGSIMPPTRLGRRGLQACLVLSLQRDRTHRRAQTRRVTQALARKGAHHARASRYLTATRVGTRGRVQRTRAGG